MMQLLLLFFALSGFATVGADDSDIVTCAVNGIKQINAAAECKNCSEEAKQLERLCAEPARAVCASGVRYRASPTREECFQEAGTGLERITRNRHAYGKMQRKWRSDFMAHRTRGKTNKTFEKFREWAATNNKSENDPYAYYSFRQELLVKNAQAGCMMTAAAPLVERANGCLASAKRRMTEFLSGAVKNPVLRQSMNDAIKNMNISLYEDDGIRQKCGDDLAKNRITTMPAANAISVCPMDLLGAAVGGTFCEALGFSLLHELSHAAHAGMLRTAGGKVLDSAFKAKFSGDILKGLRFKALSSRHHDYSAELMADSIAANVYAAGTGAMPAGRKPDVFARALAPICDSLDDGTHPSMEFRMHLLVNTPALNRALGCGRPTRKSCYKIDLSDSVHSTGGVFAPSVF